MNQNPLVFTVFQSDFEKFFSKRMFLMYSLIFHRHSEDIVALAIYTSYKNPKSFDSFERNAHGTSMSYKFNTYKIMKQNEAEFRKMMVK